MTPKVILSSIVDKSKNVSYSLHMLEVRETRSLLIVLLCGGDKSAQADDIALALKLVKEV
jgi:putative component of toxin-antitoxin plasmid stabilization module